MANAKVEFKLGEFSFSGEAEQEWLSKELDKILSKAEKIAALNETIAASRSSNDNNTGRANRSEAGNKTLSTFLKEKNATSVQTTKFLATSIWLDAKGQKTLTTNDVTSALRTAGQNKLNNASDNLNQNLSKGYCVKDGKGFYVTQEGKEALGA